MPPLISLDFFKNLLEIFGNFSRDLKTGSSIKLVVILSIASLLIPYIVYLMDDGGSGTDAGVRILTCLDAAPVKGEVGAVDICVVALGGRGKAEVSQFEADFRGEVRLRELVPHERSEVPERWRALNTLLVWVDFNGMDSRATLKSIKGTLTATFNQSGLAFHGGTLTLAFLYRNKSGDGEAIVLTRIVDTAMGTAKIQFTQVGEYTLAVLNPLPASETDRITNAAPIQALTACHDIIDLGPLPAEAEMTDLEPPDISGEAQDVGGNPVPDGTEVTAWLPSSETSKRLNSYYWFSSSVVKGGTYSLEIPIHPRLINRWGDVLFTIGGQIAHDIELESGEGDQLHLRVKECRQP